MRVNREQLLQVLESVSPGLSPKEIIEQSSCFAFKGKIVYTYNDEITCSHESPVDLTGAVPAGPLLDLLRKLPEDELELENGDGELLVRGKRRRAGVRMEKEVVLPIDSMEQPKVWTKLPEGFSEAIELVQQCASTDQSRFYLTCVNFQPQFIEASDDFQLTRYNIKTRFKEPVQVPQRSIKHVTSLGMAEFGETENWLHFRNANGLVLSCRRYLEDYPDLGPNLEVKGSPATLPKGLGEAIEKAEIFSSSNADYNQVRVELKPGKLRIKGQGALGWYSELRKIRYDGKPLSFLIPPKLLVEISQRHNEVEISEDKLKAVGDNWVFVSCLGVPEESTEE